MKLYKNVLLAASLMCGSVVTAFGAGKTEYVPFGDFNSWTRREIKESAVIGGKEKCIYEIAPDTVIRGNKPYANLGGPPWATSNVCAKVAGVVKGSNAVFPAERSHGDLCARLCTMMETVEVLHVIDMKVLVGGSIFLGEMSEPVTGTRNPMEKMDMGMAYSKRPSCVVFDYKLDVPAENVRIKSTGFGSKKVIAGRDSSVVFVFLQQRREDAEGNIYAKRVGTAGVHFDSATGWVNGYRLPIVYGDCSGRPDMEWLGLRRGEQRYYARNSKGKRVPINEDEWGDGSETPTHVILMISSAKGEPYVGTPGMTLYIDNVGFGL